MTPVVTGILVGTLALGALIFCLRLNKIIRQVGESLGRLATKDFRPVLIESHWPLFRGMAANLGKISDLLQQRDRQIVDEGFSLRAILSSMVEGVLITDRTVCIRLANEPLYRMFGLGQSLINRPVIEVFRSRELQQAIEHTLTTGTQRKIEVTLPGKHLEVHAAPLSSRPGEGPTGAVVVFHDITALKNLEAIRKEFIANVSHEFRTPLTIINGYIETLLDGATDDPAMVEKSLKAMQRNGERLNLLIEDLLTISRFEHRAVGLDIQTVALRCVVNHLLERLEPTIAERRAKVEVSWPAEDPPAEVDPQRLEQVFANLVENSLRHGRMEDIQISISAAFFGDRVEIVFRDNGPGIPYEDQPHIFERFYRVRKDRSRMAGGTGLGLSIVKHIVQAHGGTVTLESEPGTGATFRLSLPMQQENPSTPRLL